MTSGEMPLPWLLPGVVVALVASVAISDRVGRALGIRRPVAGLLILSIGIILAATLTPHANSGTVDVTLCDLSRLGPAPFREYRRLNDTTLNVLVFVPLGVAIAVVPRTGHRAALLGAAIALPFAIETVQLVVPWLARGCESADVVDNLTGLLLGLAVGTVAKRARHGMRGGGEPPG